MQHRLIEVLKIPFSGNLADLRLFASEVILSELKNTSELIGSWIMTNGRMVEDGTSCLIRDLIQHRLQKVTVASDGWEVLYRDPQDQRFWDLTFPHGEMQGGGPRTLRVLSVEEAKLKYDLPELDTSSSEMT